MTPARRRSPWERLVAAVASHRFRSWLMVGFYGGILITGVIGLYAPSQSAEDTLPDHAALILWTLLYGMTAPVGALARFKRYYQVEVLALVLISAGTALHAIFLIDQGMSGLQTGLRLGSGLFILGAIVSALLELAMTERDGQLLIDPTLLEHYIDVEVAKTAHRRTAPVEDGSEDGAPPTDGPTS